MKYLILAFLIIGCASKEPKEEPIVYSKDAPEVNTPNPKSPSITAKQLAAEKGSTFVTELRFQKGSAALNRIDKKKLNKTYQKALQSDSAKVVEIISWADKEYPKEKSLPIADQRLAETRFQAIKSYLKEVDPELSIKEVNMSKRPAKLTGLVNTYEADVKKSMEIQESYKDKKSIGMVIFLPKKR